jgi:hypothetical protein
VPSIRVQSWMSNDPIVDTSTYALIGNAPCYAKQHRFAANASNQCPLCLAEDFSKTRYFVPAPCKPVELSGRKGFFKVDTLGRYMRTLVRIAPMQDEWMPRAIRGRALPGKAAIRLSPWRAKQRSHQ